MAQKTNPVLNNFSSGELSPKMEGRVDTQAYHNGCKKLQNAIMGSQGGLTKRPGLLRIGTSKNNGKVKLIPFELSDSSRYILEFGAGYIRVWDAITETLVPDADFPTTYKTEEVSEVQFAQTEGKIFFAHKMHPVVAFAGIITLNTTTLAEEVSFRIDTVGQDIDAWDPTDTYGKGEYVSYGADIYQSMVAVNTGNSPVPAPYEELAGTVPSGVVGDISEYDDLTTYSEGDWVWFDDKLYTAGADANSAPPGTPDFIDPDSTEDLFIGYTKFKRSFGEWLSNYSPTDSEMREISAINEGVLASAVVITEVEKETLNYSTTGSSYNTLRWVSGWYYKVVKVVPVYEYYWEPADISLYAPDSFVDMNGTLHSYVAGTYNINNFVYDPTTRKVRVPSASTTTLFSDTTYWRKLSDDSNPLMNSPGNYPSAVAFMEGRLFLAGTISSPQSVMGSRVGEYTNFTMGTSDSDAVKFTIASERTSRIKWMIGKDNLMLGTSDGEWLIQGGDNGITPTSARALRQSAYGSAYRQAVFVADALLFFQKGGRRLREYVYSNDNKSYLAQDLTTMAEHITEGGIVESFYQQNPDPILWSVKEDGSLIGFTYDRLNQVAGWHTHITHGIIESATAVEGDGEEDLIWCVVRRVIDGNYVRSIERFNERRIGSQRDCVYSDSAKVISDEESFVLTNIVWTSNEITTDYSSPSGVDPTAGDIVRIKNTGADDLDEQFFSIGDLDTVNKTFTLKLSTDNLTNAVMDDFEGPLNGWADVSVLTFGGLDHLVGETVKILGDGAVFPDQVVPANGEITLSSHCHQVVAGLEYDMIVIPESLELPGQGTVGAVKRTSKVLMRLYKSLSGKIGTSYAKLQAISYSRGNTNLGEAVGMYTGDVSVPLDSTPGSQEVLIITSTDPVPFNITALVPDTAYSRM